MNLFRENRFKHKSAAFLWHFLSFFSVEVFAFFFLSLDLKRFEIIQLLPLVFGALWAVALTCGIAILPAVLGRIAYGIGYLIAIVYVGFQTGYNIIFSQMMWLSEFRYASEGSDYAQVLLSFPISWWIWIFALILQGVVMCWKNPGFSIGWKKRAVALVVAFAAAITAYKLPGKLFQMDNEEAQTDYKRAESIEAAYENMFNVHRLYMVCGVYQTILKDVYVHNVRPLLPAYANERASMQEKIDAYFESRDPRKTNEMTGILEGKNVIIVLLESLDDWMVGQHTPTIQRMMREGINFTNFYTPVYGGIRTFNSEFCMNTGLYLSSQGGYAFDFITNDYRQSLASQLREEGYSSLAFHFNTPDFYSRGEFSVAMGHEAYITYADYLEWGDEETNKISKYRLDTDDQLLFDNNELNRLFFRKETPRYNFVITKGAHLPYRYAEVASQFAFEKYPQYYGMTGHEEADCALVQAKLMDDFFARMIQELSEKKELENTVIIGVTDHYTYGIEDKQKLLELSGVEHNLLLEKTPCFIWSAGMEPMEVSKTLNTADLMPTVMNLLGLQSEYPYMGSDAFDDRYEGFVPFSNGSWISGDIAYDADAKRLLSVTGAELDEDEEFRAQMDEKVHDFIEINNLILESDYYQK